MIADLPGDDGRSTFLGMVGVFFFGSIGGLVMYLATDKEFHFGGKEMALRVREGRRERTISFNRIVKAEVVDDSDDSDADYCLKLKLRDPNEGLALTHQRGNHGQRELEPFAERINRFLGVLRKE